MAVRKKQTPQPTDDRRMFKRVLIANRGLIAANCVRAVKELGATAIVVFEDEDRDSAGVRNADEAYLLREREPGVRPYLDVDQLVLLACDCNADAVHPGYGFLAQNTDFAKRLREHGIAFLAPGEKGEINLTNKPLVLEQARKLGLATLDSSPAISSREDVHKHAKKIGFPLIVKPAYGFGGIGLRAVHSAEELDHAIEHAVTLADKFLLASNEIYLEKLLPECTHIEFPVLRDTEGHTVVFPELECSLQRRHQKLLVETPAPFLANSLRLRLESEVKVLAERLGIVGLASFEFLVRGNKAWFIEANGFVQPSHAATSLLTGVDMLKRQISILAGNTLRLQQNQVGRLGHVISSHVFAEDPDAGFAPSPGGIDRLYLPFGEGVFVQTSVFSGANVSPYYDPQIAKVLARGTTREEAVTKMDIALQEFFIEGVKNNIASLRSVVISDDYRDGRVHTQFFEDTETRARLFQSMRTDNGAAIAALVSALALQKDSNSQHILERARQNQSASVWTAASRWLQRKRKKI